MGRVLALYFIIFTQLLIANNPKTHEIYVTSTPSGVTVCYKKGKREKCFGQTPITIKIDFSNLNGSKKLIFSKLGYKHKQHYITADSKKVFVHLTKQNLFFNPKKHKNARLQQLQKKVNSKLEKLIYLSNNKFSKMRYQFIGKLKLSNTNNLVELQIDILLNDPATLKELKKAGREHNKEKKLLKTVAIFNKNDIFNLIDSVADDISFFKIDKIRFTLYYTKSKTILDFNQLTTYEKIYVGTTTSVSYSGDYKTTTSTDHYKTVVKTKDITVVRDKDILSYYTFIIPTKIYNKQSKGTYKLLNKVDILTNDTRKSKVIRLKYPKDNNIKR